MLSNRDLVDMNLSLMSCGGSKLYLDLLSLQNEIYSGIPTFSILLEEIINLERRGEQENQ